MSAAEQIVIAIERAGVLGLGGCQGDRKTDGGRGFGEEMGPSSPDTAIPDNPGRVPAKDAGEEKRR
jgi:hypothetical protein